VGDHVGGPDPLQARGHRVQQPRFHEQLRARGPKAEITILYYSFPDHGIWTVPSHSAGPGRRRPARGGGLDQLVRKCLLERRPYITNDSSRSGARPEKRSARKDGRPVCPRDPPGPNVLEPDYARQDARRPG